MSLISEVSPVGREKDKVMAFEKGDMLRSRNVKADQTKPDKTAMRKIELKNLADWFLKSRSSEKSEKTPILHSSKDNGTIPKESTSKMTDHPKDDFQRLLGEEKSTTESGEETGKPKMSILRKMCFLLSLNGWVVFVAAFLWFIPCRQPFCMEKQRDWSMDISGHLTSNMESVSTEHLSSVMFGYADENGGNLAAYSISDGKLKWNTTTYYMPRHVFCNYNHLRDKSDGVPKCVVTAYNYMAAINESKGNLLWERNITHPEGETIHKLALAGNSSLGFYILGVSDVYLFVVDAKNGSQVAALNLPCSWTIDVKLIWPLNNGNEWILICEYGDSLEAWSFEEEELLANLQKSTTEKDSSNREKFSLLFNRRSRSGAIDLSGDVTRTSASLVVSWADSVAMVTGRAPSGRPGWETSDWGATQQPSVTCILSGRFTDPDKIQIAVLVQDGYNSTIHVLDEKNGTSVMSTQLGSRSVMSMEKITGQEGETETIVIESVHGIRSKNVDDSLKLSSPRTYFTMQYTNKGVTYQNIATTDVSESTLVPFSTGAASLLIASRTPEGRTILKRLVVTSQQQETACHWGLHLNATTVLLLD